MRCLAAALVLILLVPIGQAIPQACLVVACAGESGGEGDPECREDGATYGRSNGVWVAPPFVRANAQQSQSCANHGGGWYKLNGVDVGTSAGLAAAAVTWYQGEYADGSSFCFFGVTSEVFFRSEQHNLGCALGPPPEEMLLP